jgi:hypothetical protein
MLDLRKFGLTVWAMLFVGALGLGVGWAYLRLRSSVGVLVLEPEGQVSVLAAGTKAWAPLKRLTVVKRGDRVRVGDAGEVRAAGTIFKRGSYLVGRTRSGVMGLLSSKEPPSPEEAVAFTFEPPGLVAGEAELSALRQDLERHKKMPELEPTLALLPMKTLSLKFQDFEVKLLEPPSGRRLAPGRDIWLHWTPVPFEDVSYRVEISPSMDFSKALAQGVRTNRHTVSLSGRGFYFWRVRAVRGGQSTVSKPFTLEIK